MAEGKQSRIVGEEVESLGDVPMAKIGASKPATVSKLIKTTAGVVFGDATKLRRGDTSLEMAKLRPVLVTYFEGEGFVGNWPASIPAEIGPKSSLGIFFKRYGSLPKKGMAVSAHLEDDGFYHLDL